jgi:hypothetical protein
LLKSQGGETLAMLGVRHLHGHNVPDAGSRQAHRGHDVATDARHHMTTALTAVIAWAAAGVGWRCPTLSVAGGRRV